LTLKFSRKKKAADDHITTRRSVARSVAQASLPVKTCQAVDAISPIQVRRPVPTTFYRTLPAKLKAQRPFDRPLLLTFRSRMRSQLRCVANRDLSPDPHPLNHPPFSGPLCSTGVSPVKTCQAVDAISPIQVRRLVPTTFYRTLPANLKAQRPFDRPLLLTFRSRMRSQFRCVANRDLSPDPLP
jgi:hypothetical protein